MTAADQTLGPERKALSPLLLPAILLMAALVRLALILIGWNEPLADLDNYLELSRSLADGQGFRLAGRLTAYRPPLYPLLLAPIQAVAGSPLALKLGIGLLHIALGLLTVWLTALTARRWGLPPRRCLIAAALVALDPVLAAQARLVMTETLAALLVALCLFTLARPGLYRPMALGGLAFGLAALCRPSLLAVAGLVVFAHLGLSRTAWRSRGLSALLFLALIFSVLSPWAIRNRLVLDQTIWTTTHGGYTLALGNNPAYYDEVLNGPPGAVWSGQGQQAWWDSLGLLTAGCNESQADRVIRDHAIQTIRSRPADFARATLDRLARFWGIWPSSSVYPFSTRLATALWTLPLWLALAASLLQADTWRWPRITALAFLVGLSVVHAFFWTDMRMRAPIVPAIALLAATAQWPFPRLRKAP